MSSEELEELVERVEQGIDLIGKEYAHQDIYECVCSSLVSSQAGAIFHFGSIDAEPSEDGREAVIVFYYSLETDYYYKPPFVPCYNCQENNIVPPPPPNQGPYY